MLHLHNNRVTMTRYEFQVARRNEVLRLFTVNQKINHSSFFIEDWFIDDKYENILPRKNRLKREIESYELDDAWLWGGQYCQDQLAILNGWLRLQYQTFIDIGECGGMVDNIIEKIIELKKDIESAINWYTIERFKDLLY